MYRRSSAILPAPLLKHLTMRTAVLFTWLVLVVCLLNGCGSEAPPKNDVSNVKYIVLQSETVTLSRELPGRVSAFQVSEVRPQVGGIIQKRLFDEGADVVAGQVLYEIDPSLYEAAYKNAEANLAREKANLVAAANLAERYRKIVKTDAISKQEYDDAVASHGQAKAAVQSASEALETAKINLGYTKVIAPVSGRIGRSFVTPGALATQNQAAPLATVQQLSPVYVDVTQSNVELLKLRRALAAGRLQSSGADSAKVKLVLEDGSPYAKNALSPNVENEVPVWIEGELLFSDVTVEQSTGVVTLRATFENPHNVLLPGMYVRALLEEGVKENAILIPQRAMMRNTKGQPYVFVLTTEKPEAPADSQAAAQLEAGPVTLPGGQYYVAMRSIAIDRDIDNHWLVTSGLSEGDLLLVDGQLKTRPGQIVAGIELKAEANGPAQLAQAPESGVNTATR